MNGYEFAERCRNSGDATPIVAVTAAGLPGEREHCLRAGMNDYLLKPFSLSVLAALLERHMRHVRPARLAGGVPDTAAQHALQTVLGKWDSTMTDTVVESLTKDIADLRGALGDAQASQLEQVVHRVEGGMATLDIRPAMALCRAIRDSIEYEWLDLAFRLAPTLDAMLTQTVVDVRAARKCCVKMLLSPCPCHISTCGAGRRACRSDGAWRPRRYAASAWRSRRCKHSGAPRKRID